MMGLIKLAHNPKAPEWDEQQLSTFEEADWAAERRQSSIATAAFNLRLVMMYNWTTLCFDRWILD